MSKKIKYYNLDKIDHEGANINMIIGERSNGKSYQVKHKKGIEKYYYDSINYHANYTDKNKIISEIIEAKTRRFILVRQLKEETKESIVTNYFNDIDVDAITNHEYTNITVYRGRVYLSNYDMEKNKMIRGEMIGYIIALSIEQNFAGASFLDVTDIIYEEFISRTSYIPKVADKLMNLFCTVDRKRGVTRVWMVGNTISFVCPFFVDWGLLDDIKKMKQGDMITKWIPTGEVDDEGTKIEIKVAIEWCESTGSSSFVIGRHGDMLNKGELQTDPQPHLEKSIKEYKFLYKIGFFYKTYKFIGVFIQDKETKDTNWFIYPTHKFNKKLIIFSDIIKQDRRYQTNIYKCSLKSKNLQNILNTFTTDRIFYATDLAGTDFKQVINFEIRK